MSAHSRPDRVGQLLQEKLGELLLRRVKDPRLGFVTITVVKMSVDLREAQVYWTVHGDEGVRAQTERGLLAARGYLRRECGHALGLRATPDLHFHYDEAIDRGERIDRLLREVDESDRRRAAAAPEEEGDFEHDPHEGSGPG